MTIVMTIGTPSSHTDIQSRGWWHGLPASWHPFIYLARLDRPIGWWLLLLPGWWSIALGATSLSSMVWVMMLFLIGAIATRAAGCIINDMWDRRLDQRVVVAVGLLGVGHGEAANQWRNDLATAENELRRLKREEKPKLKEELQSHPRLQD